MQIFRVSLKNCFLPAFVIFGLLFTVSGKAQEQANPAPPKVSMSPPIPLELFFGHEQLNFQLIVKKKFSPTSKFDLLAISIFSEKVSARKLLK